MTHGVLAAEWVKLRSVRSMYLTLPAACAVAFAFSVMPFNGDPDRSAMNAAALAEYDAVRYCYSGGFLIAVLTMGVLGALAITSEYGTGLIRTTFAAVPRRRTVLAAKALVVGGLALLIGEILAFAIFFAGQSLLSGKRLSVGLGDPHVLRAVLGAGFFLSVTALIGLALGTIVRRGPGAVAAVLGLYFVSNLVTPALGDGADAFAQWTPVQILQGLTATRGSRPTWPSPAMAFVECGVYLVILFSIAAVVISRRDA
jgi:ABC-2 type transport system permease protein